MESYYFQTQVVTVFRGSTRDASALRHIAIDSNAKDAEIVDSTTKAIERLQVKTLTV